VTRTVTAEPGTIVVYGDVICPWSHLATFRLFRARERLGLSEDVTFDMRAFPMELINGKPTSKRGIESEIPVIGGLDPEAGWQLWKRPSSEWPVTTLPALEAIEAAKLQGVRAGEQLGRELRRAFFAESRCVSLRTVILEVAGSCDLVDADLLADDLDSGRARPEVISHWRDQEEGPVQVSPHLFLPDGTDHPNPGIEKHWDGAILVIDSDDPSVYDELVRRAAS